MRRPFITVATGIVCAGLISCGDSCSEYSAYNCRQLEKATYNVQFSFPNSDQDYFLGTVEGLSACGATAHEYAASKNLSGNSEWGYVCCLKTDRSECAEKHR